MKFNNSYQQKSKKNETNNIFTFYIDVRYCLGPKLGQGQILIG